MQTLRKIIACPMLATLFLAIWVTPNAYAQNTEIATEDVDITALRLVAQDILQKLPEDEVPKANVRVDDKWQPVYLQPDVITDGVVSDYITVIKFMAGRKVLAENRRDPMSPPAPRYYHLEGRKTSAIIYHNTAYYSFENDFGQPIFPSYSQKVVRFQKVCVGECAKILFENYADEVIFVTYHPETRAIMPESIRSFRRKADCDISDGHLQSRAYTTHSLPAIGLCTQTTIPKKPLSMARRDGLHVYTNMASPFWPDEFEADYIAVGPSSSQSPKAFETLDHITAFSSITHRAHGVKVGGSQESFAIKYEQACVSIQPALPKRVIEKFIVAAAGENSLHKAYGEPLKVKDGSICHGKVPDKDAVGFFKRWDTVNGRVEFAKIFSHQDI